MENMENFWVAVAWIAVLGGGAWAGAKAAFLTTLFLKVLFGKVSEPQQQPQVMIVPVHNHYGHYRDEDPVIIEVNRS